MKIALYDVDSVIPNLALMKLSHFWKDRGADIVPYLPLFAKDYDEVFASKVFKFSDDSALDKERMTIGGTGWDITSALPPEVEVLQPDYSFYDYPHSIGFTMRGCRFRCKFCVVPLKEGRPKSTATINEIWQQRDSNFIVLLDNDFFGNPNWAARIAEIQHYGLRVNYSQGLNIRIITDEQARALAAVNFSNIKGSMKQVHFAWDRIRDERLIDAGITRVIDAGIKPYQMSFYVLVGFDTTPEDDLRRVTYLRDRGCDSYVMPYNREDEYQRRFARWVNHKAIFKSVPWAEYRASVKSSDETTFPLFASDPESLSE